MKIDDKKPLISCITPTYNRAELLVEAIESTIAQTYPNWEMIIVNDSSNDNTDAVVKEYMLKEPRIRYFKQEKSGANHARNFALKQAKGKYVVFIDDDDLHLPHRFESQLNAALRSGKRFILSGYQVLNNRGEVVKKITKGLTGKAAGIGIRWFIEKDLLFQAGLFDPDMPAMQEIELSYRIAEFEIFANHDDIVVSARPTANSISSGLNGLKGKVMLLEKHEVNMHPAEAAWWYFIIAMEYYRNSNLQQANLYFKKAASLDDSKLYSFAHQYYRLTKFISNRFAKKVNLKVLLKICYMRFPKVIEHPVVNG